MRSIRNGKVDKVLLFAVLCISLFGILFVHSATYDPINYPGQLSPLAVKQCIWILTGLLIMLLVTKIDFFKILNISVVLYILNLLLLVLLFTIGGERFGARRWLILGPISLQPSEFVKITFILVLAAFLGERRERGGSFSNFFGALFIAFPAMALIFLQPDLGTALVLIPILFSMLFICGENIKYMLAVIIAGLSALPVLWNILRDYQKTRLMVFLNPNLDPLGAGYTIIQSKIAIGSGGLFGKGWMNGTQSYLKFLPERHTDFIFSVIGEELGFIGAIGLVACYALIFIRGVRILYKSTNIYERAIAAGVITLIAFQVFVNLSMTIGIMPVVGLPLPVISYGGSGTITALIGMGLLLNISKRTSR